MSRLKRVTVPCAQCGKDLDRIPSRVKRTKHHFCNRECMGKWEKAQNIGQFHPGHSPSPQPVQCAHCEKISKRKPSGVKRAKQFFCSNECRFAYKAARKVDVSCTHCGKIIIVTRYKFASRQNGHFFCCLQCRDAERHNSGKGWVRYYGPNWDIQRRAARERDCDTCQACGYKAKQGESLDVHHIVPIKKFGYIFGKNDHYLQANHLSNLVSLCPSCHKKIEQGKLSLWTPLAKVEQPSRPEQSRILQK